MSLVKTAAEKLAFSKFSPTFVFTDSHAIAEDVRDVVDVVVDRPPEVSEDKTTSEESIQVFLETVDPEDRFTALAMVQCTTPFLWKDDLDKVHEKFMTGSWASVLTAASFRGRFLGYPNLGSKSEFIPMFPYRSLRQVDESHLWMENGGCYCAKIDLWKANRRIMEPCGVVEMPWWRSIEIDSPEDLEVARALVALEVDL